MEFITHMEKQPETETSSAVTDQNHETIVDVPAKNNSVADAPAKNPGDRMPPHSIGYAGLTIMLFGGMLGGLTQTAMNTLLSTVVLDLGVPVSTGQWLINIFPLCLGVIIPLSGFLSRHFKPRSLFLFAVGLFIIGTTIIAVSSSFALLLVGRIFQGCATGVIFPLLQTIGLTHFPRSKSGVVMGFIGLTMGFAPNVGPTIAGAFSTAFGWRSCFLFLLVFSSIVLAIAIPFLRKTPSLGKGDDRIDTVSVVFSTLGFGGLLLGLSDASQYSIGSWMCLVPCTVGVVFLAAFCVRQGRVDNPLIKMDVFSYKAFSIGTVIVCLLFCAFIGVTLVIPLDVQTVHGRSALESGLVLLPGVIGALVASPLAGALMDRIGARPVCCVATLLVLLGTFMLLDLGNMDSLVEVSMWQTVRTLGISSLIMPVTTWSLNALPMELIPDGSSMTNSVRQIAAALGTAVMVLLMSAGTAGGAATAQGVNDAMMFSFAVTVLLAVLCFAFVKDRGQRNR